MSLENSTFTSRAKAKAPQVDEKAVDAETEQVEDKAIAPRKTTRKRAEKKG